MQQTEEFRAMRALVRNVLENPAGREWSVQGFGMMRTYIDPQKVYRLNVWDSRFQVPGVSTIHDHPWDFISWIMGGQFTNRRYVEDYTRGEFYDHALIHTGIGGDNSDTMRGKTAGIVRLRAEPDEVYQPGDTYRQVAEEIHASLYTNGTVTLNERVRRPDGDHAKVYWPQGQQWVDAQPRLATPSEVSQVLALALTGATI